jgi:hypothetical protein
MNDAPRVVAVTDLARAGFDRAMIQTRARRWTYRAILADGRRPPLAKPGRRG